MRQTTKEAFIRTVRGVTSPFLFPKRMPKEFGGERILVTTRSDLRYLFPGLDRVGFDLFSVVRSCIKRGDAVWDIGSNLGLFSLAARHMAGVEGRVYSLEADPAYAEVQARTVRSLKGEGSPISILCAAAADTNAVLEFNIPIKGHSRSHLSVVPGNEPGDIAYTKQVPSVTLDWLLSYWRYPNFVKIDVEGAEHLVVRGATQLLTKIRPLVYFECNKLHVNILTRYFTDIDYDFFGVTADGLREEPRLLFNTLLVPHERRSLLKYTD